MKVSGGKRRDSKIFGGSEQRVVKNFDCCELWESVNQEGWASDSMLVSLKTAAGNSGKKVSSRARKVVTGEGENPHHDG